MHSIEPVGLPPSHVVSTDGSLFLSVLLVSEEIITSNGSTNLPPSAAQSSPSSLCNCIVFSFCSNVDESCFGSSIPKSNVNFHLPGDHGEGDVSCDDEDRGDDDELNTQAALSTCVIASEELLLL